MTIRIATYNIQYGFGQDGEYDLDRTADGLTGADIICLQEVTTHWSACRGDHQPDKLSAKLDLFSVYSPGFELDSSYRKASGRVVNERRSFGNMLLSRWPILYARSHSLPRPAIRTPENFADPRTDLPRCVLEGIVDVPGKPLRVMSVHLSHLPGNQRLVQVETLRLLLQSLPLEAPLWERSDPAIKPWTQGDAAPPVAASTIVAGDFNFGPEDAEYKAMLQPIEGVQLVDGWRYAWPSSRPHAATCTELDGSGSTLDYAFFTRDLSDAIARAEVRDHSKASDHFPLVFELDS